jgi:hypothetical protein
VPEPLRRIETITIWSGTIYWMHSRLIAPYFGKNDVGSRFHPPARWHNGCFIEKGRNARELTESATTASAGSNRLGN